MAVLAYSLLVALAAHTAGFAENPRRIDVDGSDIAPIPCVRKIAAGYQEPETLQSLLDCQFKFRIGWVRRFNERLGAPPNNASLDKLDDLQRTEVREYLSRHPDRAHTDDETAAQNDGQSPRAKIAPKDCGPRATAERRTPTDPQGAFAKQQERTEKAMDSNLKGQDPGLAQDLAALERSLSNGSDEGRSGITQDGALQIVEFLECEQGGASDDMQDLLNHVVRDGGKLQNDTMLRLKSAARDAQASGLDLGVDAGLGRWLLDEKTDPADDPNGPNPTAGDVN